MQTLIKEYGEAILAAVVSALIIGLIFGGLALTGKLGIITGSLDKGLIKEAKASSETALKKHMDVAADNMSMSGDVTVCCGRKIYYEKNGQQLIGIKNGEAKRIHIVSAWLLKDNESDNEGYEVTDQILHESDDEESYLMFVKPGNYRLVVSVTDSENIVSDYQVFVTAVNRRNV